MINNYIKTALRNLIRYKGFAFINILGLSLSATACLIIGLFIFDEQQYDQFIEGKENIYRFYTQKSRDGGSTYHATVPPVFATSMEQYPEVVTTARVLMTPGRRLMKTPAIQAYEDNGLVVDSTFLSVLPLPFLKGNPATALNDPGSVVLSRKTATKYFGKNEALGKTISINNSDFIVQGILDDLPEQFHLDINYLMPLAAAGLNSERMKSWRWQQFYTYVKLKPGTNVQDPVTKFQAETKKQLTLFNRDSDIDYTPYLQKLTDIHLYSSDFIYDNARRGNISYIKGLTATAIFLLLIACFNFINLATARSMRRAKEIGVRKVIGANRHQLIIQFTVETILLAVAAVLLAVIATLFLMPLLNNFTARSISFKPFSDPALTVLLLGGAVSIGIIAGIYPAFFMSAFRPIKVLKGSPSTAHGNSGNLRHALVVLQFTLSALLITTTMIVYRQINFLHQKDLGFEKDQVIYFNAPDKVSDNPEAFKNELLNLPGVIAATAGYGLPGDMFAGDGVKIPGKFDGKNVGTSLFITDYDYIKTLGLHVVAGRAFSKEFATDAESGFIINETAVREFGFETPEKALGQKINWDKWITDSINPVKKGEVIGVIKDFHYKSLYEKVNPAVLIIYPPIVAKVAIKINSADLPQTISGIKSVWNRFSPDFPLDYNFLDENFDKMYKSEEKLSGLLLVFTAIAIFIGCLGLFGLVAFSAEQRVKEIGIRKVLGASAANIVTLLSKNFIVLIGISLLIASPLAWWIMQNWLQDYAYKINIGWQVFALAGATALSIAMITICFQAVKAAVTNPVKSLRSE